MDGVGVFVGVNVGVYVGVLVGKDVGVKVNVGITGRVGVSVGVGVGSTVGDVAGVEPTTGAGVGTADVTATSVMQAEAKPANIATDVTELAETIITRRLMGFKSDTIKPF